MTISGSFENNVLVCRKGISGCGERSVLVWKSDCGDLPPSLNDGWFWVTPEFNSAGGLVYKVCHRSDLTTGAMYRFLREYGDLLTNVLKSERLSLSDEIYRFLLKNGVVDDGITYVESASDLRAVLGGFGFSEYEV